MSTVSSASSSSTPAVNPNAASLWSQRTTLVKAVATALANVNAAVANEQIVRQASMAARQTYNAAITALNAFDAANPQ